MHPILIIVPVLGAVFGPRLWARAELRRFDVADGAFLPADQLARRLLDRQGLTLVRVEVTDLGDHYDPQAKAVRLSRAHLTRSSLTAATTAAHEVGHALQDAAGHWAFRLHHALARLAQVTTGAGAVLLLAVPAAAIAAQTPAPARLLSLAAAGMLGTGLAAQLAALPSELDASMNRALPLLRDCCLSDDQVRDARRILLACSLTYLASAAVPALALWPFVGPRLLRSGLLPPVSLAPQVPVQREREHCRADAPSASAILPQPPVRAPSTPQPGPAQRPGVWRAAPRRQAGRPGRVLAPPGPARAPDGEHGGGRQRLRALARPLVRRWLLLTGDY
ncbi:zinc metallopeptidase [uncultured Thiohalocapsa sp.]|uniref:zinc metallopeptidase n=1 Tax=uncultured Thiohalocapsa sp. TaxID=768990 RepID=UPI0025D41968|nr:zinc metallopeptidase [uncultured Thiohalocapsa sp.]